MIITYMPNYVRIEDFNNTLHKNDRVKTCNYTIMDKKVTFSPQIHMFNSPWLFM